MRRIRTLLSLVAAGVFVSTASLHAQLVERVGMLTAQWKYSIDNSDQYALGFPTLDDSAWPSSTALFGNDGGYPYPFIVQFNGPGGTPAGPLTSYYRTRFNWVGSTAGVVLTMTNYIDDGYVIYLNGTEIQRYDVNDPPFAHATLAPTANPAGEGVAIVRQVALDALTNGNPNPLIAGENIVAVSVHSAGAGSSDAAFGMSVYSSQVIPPQPTPTTPADITAIQCRNATFTVTQVPGSGVPAPTIQWFRNVGSGPEELTGQTGSSLTVSNVQPANAGEYWAVLTNPGNVVPSRHALLTVTTDTAPPQVTSVVFLAGANNEFLVTYNEPIDLIATLNAVDTFNYVFVGADGHSINAASVTPDPNNPAVFHANVGEPIHAGVAYTYHIGEDSEIEDACNRNATPIGTLTGPVTIPGPISVGASGTAVYAFASAPYAEEFSTGPFPGAADGVADTAALFGAKVVALDIATLGNVLPPVDGNPPGAGATGRWAREGQYLVTRPTGTAGDVIVAHLVNNSGAAQTGVEITYNLTALLPVVEEVPGYLVYYSVSGAAGSWIQIPGISGDRTTGLKTGVADLSGSPWMPGSLLHILFADDNGSGSPDDVLEIDNFSAKPTSVVVTAPEITLDPVSGGVTVGHTFRLTAAATGSSPSFQWYKVGTPDTAIPGATTATYTAVADATSGGGYYVIASNSAATDRSATATITVRPVVTPYGAVWKYETNSQDATLTGGTPWYAIGFNDSAWPSGPGLLGAETAGNGATRLPAPIGTVLPPPSATFLTAYFRTTVTVPALTAGQSLVLTHYIDDGAAIYVDGTLATRYNLPMPLPIYSTNLAPGAVPGDSEANLISVPITLSPGQHTIAVEVHQNSATSSDVVFGLELRVISSTAPALTITKVPPLGVDLTWAANPLYSLFSATTVTGPYTHVLNATNSLGTFSVLNATNPASFFRIGFNGQ